MVEHDQALVLLRAILPVGSIRPYRWFAVVS
jgi:hypothetical protein